MADITNAGTSTAGTQITIHCQEYGVGGEQLVERFDVGNALVSRGEEQILGSAISPAMLEMRATAENSVPPLRQRLHATVS